MGNTEGQTLSDTVTAQADVAATQTWDYPELMVGSNGFLPNDRKHQFKAGTVVPAYLLVESDKQGATRHQRRVVVFPVGGSVLGLCWRAHAARFPRAQPGPLHGKICATTPQR